MKSRAVQLATALLAICALSLTGGCADSSHAARREPLASQLSRGDAARLADATAVLAGVASSSATRWLGVGDDGSFVATGVAFCGPSDAVDGSLELLVLCSSQVDDLTLYHALVVKVRGGTQRMIEGVAVDPAERTFEDSLTADHPRVDVRFVLAGSDLIARSVDIREQGGGDALAEELLGALTSRDVYLRAARGSEEPTKTWLDVGEGGTSVLDGFLICAAPDSDSSGRFGRLAVAVPGALGEAPIQNIAWVYCRDDSAYSAVVADWEGRAPGQTMRIRVTRHGRFLTAQ